MQQEIVGYTQEELSTALEVMEASMVMGQHAQISICTEQTPSQAVLGEFYGGMVEAGFHLSHPTTRLVDGIPTTEFTLRKGSPFWPMLIPIIVPVLTMGLIAFGIIKIADIATAIMPLVLITIGGLVVLAATLRKPVTAYIERGGSLALKKA